MELDRLKQAELASANLLLKNTNTDLLQRIANLVLALYFASPFLSHFLFSPNSLFPSPFAVNRN